MSIQGEPESLLRSWTNVVRMFADTVPHYKGNATERATTHLSGVKYSEHPGIRFGAAVKIIDWPARRAQRKVATHCTMSKKAVIGGLRPPPLCCWRGFTDMPPPAPVLPPCPLPPSDASANGDVKTLTDLLDAAAEGTHALIDCEDASNGNTPLHASCSNGHLACITLLLTRGANVNVQNRLGQTPLHCCAESKQSNALRLLLVNQCDWRATDASGKTARQVASANSVPGTCHRHPCAFCQRAPPPRGARTSHTPHLAPARGAATLASTSSTTLLTPHLPPPPNSPLSANRTLSTTTPNCRHHRPLRPHGARGVGAAGFQVAPG